MPFPELLDTAVYGEQQGKWPQSGRHILAHYDDETIIVYQAYRREIGSFAAEHGYFGGAFSYNRMSWVKPNFLWMMYRSDWGRSEGQEVVLAVRVRRAFFEGLLARAVPSTFRSSEYAEERAWQDAVRRSDVRLQWDPDHLPSGQPCARRALQLGLRGRSLAAYGTKEALDIIDVSEFVAAQREHLKNCPSELRTPVERVYLPNDLSLAVRLGLTTAS